MKDKGQRTRDGGTEDGKQRAKDRTSGIEPDIGTVDRQGTEHSFLKFKAPGPFNAPKKLRRLCRKARPFD
jgi:hypothetical protein